MWGTERIIDILEQQPVEKRKETYKLLVRQTNELDEGIQSDAFLEFKDSSQNLSIPLINDTHEQDNHNELQGFLGHHNLERIQSDAFLEDASPTENSGSVLRRPSNQRDESCADLSWADYFQELADAVPQFQAGGSKHQGGQNEGNDRQGSPRPLEDVMPQFQTEASKNQGAENEGNDQQGSRGPEAKLIADSLEKEIVSLDSDVKTLDGNVKALEERVLKAHGLLFKLKRLI
ncbi:hypothetical protein SLEP1_g42837 [Rubroshorea leprosula]|uniref:Uncharacterized protein n=1 Tax=Rubroshorea leprosula TaxID=152421 RepID=A0AAV5LB51_9ROSI|nr:hypothetical protein SLEP1_g42837 [Rubroshorea leprosula]